MKKYSLWLMLAIFAVGLVLMSGIFIGRITSGDRVQVEKNNDSSVKQEAPALLDINSATIEELTDLPGIGESLAQRIVDYREQNGPFQAVEELLNVSGIGEAKLNRIIDYVTVGG